MELDINNTRPNKTLASKFKDFEQFYKWADKIYKGGKEAVYDWWLKSGGKAADKKKKD